MIENALVQTFHSTDELESWIDEQVAAKDVVVDEVGPSGRGGTKPFLVPVYAVGGDLDPLEGRRDLSVDVLEELFVGRLGESVELSQRIAAVEFDEVDLIAGSLHLGEVCAPTAVDQQQREALFDRS